MLFNPDLQVFDSDIMLWDNITIFEGGGGAYE
jgi:hypothetical protein